MFGFSSGKSTLLTETEMTPIPRESKGNFTAPYYATASLCSDFTGLIERAASRLEITLPPIPSNPEVDMMVGGPSSRPRRAAVPLTLAVPSL